MVPTDSTPAPVYVGGGGVSAGGGMHPRPSERGIENGELHDKSRTKDKLIVSRTMLGQTGADVKNKLYSND